MHPKEPISVAALSVSIDKAIRWLLFPEDRRTILIQQLALAGLVAVAVLVLGPLTALSLAALAVAGAIVLMSPSKPVLATFVLFIAFTHQFRSFFTIHIAGVELHPREVLLAALLAHAVAKSWMGRCRYRHDPIDYFVVAVGIFFVFTAANGVSHHRDWHLIVSEIRSPVFLLSYFVFIVLADAKDLPFYVRTVGALTLVLALVSITYFVFALATGNVVSTQNVLGEFVQRQIQGVLVPSVRPAGHMYYEVSLVVFTSLAFCPALAMKRRMLFLGLAAVLGLAVAITMMRTAYVSVAVSLVILGFLALPSHRTRFTVAWLGAVVVAVVVALFSTVLHDAFLSAFPRIGVSIQARLVEISGAFQEFLKNPLVGAGLGSTFEALGLATKTSQIAYAQSSFQTIHNVWMYFPFKGGLIGGLIISIGYGGLFFEMCRRSRAYSGPVQRCFMRGLAAALGAQLVASAGMPRLLYPKGYVFIAMVAAYAVLTAPRAKATPVCRPATAAIQDA